MTFLQLSDSEKMSLIDQMYEETKLPQVIIEKDVWVTAVLRALFSLPYSQNLSFKGGTSLSKCYDLIERFSEDVDISINREFFGFTGDRFTVKQISKDLRKATCKFIRNELQFDLANRMQAVGIPADLFSVKMNISPITTIDPEKVFIEYKSVLSPNPYIRNTVVLEIGGRSMKEPLQKVKVQSLINKHFTQATFVEKPFEINAVAAERTFLEKICLLHEEFAKPSNIRVERMSRHLYDLVQMIDTPIMENALKNKELYESIIAHRRMFIAMKGFDYDTLAPKTIRIVPPDHIIDLWKADYEAMQETMIYGNALSFKDLIDKIRQLNKAINQMDW